VLPDRVDQVRSWTQRLVAVRYRRLTPVSPRQFGVSSSGGPGNSTAVIDHTSRSMGCEHRALFTDDWDRHAGKDLGEADALRSARATYE
jgi:hypothetical protein